MTLNPWRKIAAPDVLEPTFQPSEFAPATAPHAAQQEEIFQ
jgi:hypothetical protein